jgi:hypothetical protein
MARHLFGGGIADWTFDLGDAATAGSGASGNLAVVVPAVSVTFYDSPTTGTQYSDLTDLSSVAISSITSDSSGEMPQFYGPDDVYFMWADASGGAGPRRVMVATDLGPVVQALTEQVANLQNTVDNLTALCALMVVANREALGSYPDRPALAGDRLVLWAGDDTPAGGGAPGMAEGDLYADTAP